MKIEFDYRFDTKGFFNDPNRRAALEKAASIWESYLKDDFEAIPVGIEFNINNPETGQSSKVVLDKSIDDIVIFVGSSSPPFAGTTGAGIMPAETTIDGCKCSKCQAIAQGLFDLSQPGILVRENPENIEFPSQNSGALAIAQIEGGDIKGDIFQRRIADKFRNASVTDFEPWAGTISFDPTINWDFSLNQAVAGKTDFVSIALHEIAHILGIGISPVFLNLVQNGSFTGTNAKNTNNGNAISLTGDSGHVIDGFLNNTVLMDPIYNGGRSLPSQIDLAMLADIGYEINGFTTIGSTQPLSTNNGETIFGTIVNDRIDGLGGNDRIQGDLGNDTIVGGLGDDSLFGQDGGDVFVFGPNNGKDSIYDFSVAVDKIELATGLGINSGADVLTKITRTGTTNSPEFPKYTEITISSGNTVAIFHDGNLTSANFAIGTRNIVELATFLNNPLEYMTYIRDFDGNDLGSTSTWKSINKIDVQGDGDIEHVFVNPTIGRWATVGANADDLIDFSNHGQGGDTRVVGIYEDPLVKSQQVVKGSDFDSQRRFQNDLSIDNLTLIENSGQDYDKNGLQEIYFKVNDGTAVLHAYMHADGNIQYANYQSKDDLSQFMNANGVDSSLYSSWF